MKFIDWFAGIGGFRRGMELAGHECVGFCEFDKFATASYISMHLLANEQRRALQELPLKKRQKEILKDEYRNGEWYANDVRRVCADDIPKADCWCFGFPCQDISVAGKQLGFQGNRSSLFFRIMYLIGQLKEEDKPTYLFIENVKNLLSVNGGWDFARLLIEMEQGGYDAEWQVLNSKDFGVPQNRERCFIIGHLRGRSSAEVFPVERADEKNNIATKPEVLGKINSSQDGKVFSVDGISQCCSAGHANCPKIAIPVITPDRVKKRQNGRRFKENGEPMFALTKQDKHGIAINVDGFNCMPDGTCRTLKNQYQKNSGINFMLTTSRGDTAAAVKVSEATKKGYAQCRVGVDSVNLSVPGSKTRRGRVGTDIANTLDTSCNQGIFVQVSEELGVYAIWYEKYQCYIAIRKLTPKECFRLQGWTDDCFEKAQLVNSDSQLYKQAGNGVTVNVIKAIAERMETNG